MAVTGSVVLLAVLLGAAGAALAYAVTASLVVDRLGSWADCLVSGRAVVVAVTGLLWGVISAWSLAGGMTGSMLPVVLALLTAGVLLTVIDSTHHRLPDALVLPLYPVTVLGLALDGFVTGRWPVVPAILGGVVWIAVVGLPWLISGGRGMGFGDVKLAPVLGVTLGWVALSVAVAGLLIAFLLGAAVGVGLMIARRAGRRTAIPFGPFLLVGALLGLVVGPALVQAYTELLTGG